MAVGVLSLTGACLHAKVKGLDQATTEPHYVDLD